MNFFLGWLIRALFFVPALLTMGLLFLFVPFLVNVVLLWMTDKLLANFAIQTTGALLVTALAITVVNSVFYASLVSSAWQVETPHGVFHGGQPRWI